MENKENEIDELFRRLDQLTRQQKVFQDEIQQIQRALYKLKNPQVAAQAPPPVVPSSTVSHSVTENVIIAPSPLRPPPLRAPKSKTRWEEFIGTNLLNKVGIAVLVLGIGFGAKYSIDHDLVNPLTRIILGYLSGIALIGVAFRLRESHAAFSAVLLSGGMAVLYFITYAAYDFYGLIPQLPAFILMVLFTFFTVFAALQYNVEVIAIIGLVGAYAVPILLSDGSGRAVILFSYITIINACILFLAFRKYWKRLYYISFILTWLTFASWYAFSFEIDTQATLSLIFSTIFFATFYVTFLAYKLIRREALGRWDVVFMLLNSFVYFGYGYLTIDSLPEGEQYLGLFTVWTALLHFAVCVVIYKKQKDFRDSFFFVAGMVLVFLTIAVPVQLEGNWVTLVWSTEAALLFWIGRTKNFAAYEKLSYPLMALAVISLLHDWSDQYPAFYHYSYDFNADFTIFLNVHFLTSAITAAALIFISVIRQRHTGADVIRPDSTRAGFLSVGLPLIAAFVLYAGAYKEIEAFWNNAYGASRIPIKTHDGVAYDQYNTDLLQMRNVWLLIYSAVFVSCVSLLSFRRRNNAMAIGALVINALVLLAFVTGGLFDLASLRASYVDQGLAQYYDRGIVHILIRYIAIAVMLPLLWFNHKIVRHPLFGEEMRRSVQLYFHFIVLFLLSSELVHWLELAEVENSFKLSLSILWGCYGLFLVVLGLSRDLKHIRVGGIILFAITLLKLFGYDMSNMSTILKTIVMVTLGALLLTASYIYNKYKSPTENEAP